MRAQTAPKTFTAEPSSKAVQALRQAAEHYEQGSWAEAAVAAASAAEEHARYTAAYHLLALALDRLGQNTKAFEMFERAIALDPTNAALTLDIANAGMKRGQHEGAEKAFRAYLALRPDCPNGVGGLSATQLATGRLDEALDLVRKALQQTPESASLLHAEGAILIEACEFDGAIAAYAAAQRLAPAQASTFHNKAHAQSHTGAFDAAIANFTRALELSDNEADRAQIRHARGLCHAATGNLAEAWHGYEQRHAFANATHFAAACPRWEGENLQGNKLLLIGEQGLGDEIMFASLIPDLMKQVGPTGKLMIAVDQRLVPLVQRSFPGAAVGAEMCSKQSDKPVRVVPWATGDLAPDMYVPMGSALAHLRRTVESFPARAYMKPDPARVRHWLNRLAALGPGPHVGVSWKSMLATTARKKFFSALREWRPILESTSVKFVNLQYGDCRAELDAVCNEFGVTIHTFADTDLTNAIDDKAALCDALDLVVSAPTAPAMLAAAVGTETWLLTAAPLWQQLGTGRYPWYANTRVLTPEKFADWPSLMPSLAREIEAFAAR